MATGLGEALTRLPVAVVAAAISLLPRRLWDRFDRWPVRAMVWLSALAVLCLGLWIWVQGIREHVFAAADLGAQATIDQARRQISGQAPETPLLMTGPQVFTVATLIGFTLFTPVGLLAVYLALSSLARFVSVAARDPVGDPLLSAIDAGIGLVRGRRRERRRRFVRERAEGPDIGDRRYAGADAGLPDADFVIVSARRKPGWTPGSIVIAGGEWYRVGRAFDVTQRHGLRAVYPLTRIEKTEVLRKASEYAFTPLLRVPSGSDLKRLIRREPF